ncbi:F-actin-capping protein subunit beta [Radiomyces spectabilis]|uniref:F-actin-capping protein subunit beta n=1 Tax=Radiomyces spectabilis TaxID=64574 RepID=UPI0022209002|nr:F-actin-capping protein subunit beta [Radiomyces spectabilis]KAI8373159.1 F-actin-capping protein subunit beta [Radiomyces spectabilis]
MDEQYESALDLMRRLPPQNIEENMGKLMDLVHPDLVEELLSAIDQPLKVRRCEKTGRDYLICDYNRDGDSYRSPWSNEYDPELPDGTLPSPSLRKLEVAANDAFDTYRELYYAGGVSSVYTFDIDDKFAVVVLIKKVGDGVRRMKGAWDSIHVFEVQERGRNAHYKLTSTVMLYMITNNDDLGNMNLSGSMTRQSEQDYPVDDPSAHVANIGRMVEDMESKMRNSLREVYFGKTKDIVNDLRSLSSIAESKRQAKIQQELVGRLMERST